MKPTASFVRAATVVAALALTSLAIAQPPPGGQGGPGYATGPGQPSGKKNKKQGGANQGGPNQGGQPQGGGGGRLQIVIPGITIGGGPIPPRYPRHPMPPIPPPPVAPHRTRVVYSDSESVTAQVQRKLKTLGYYTSTVDGDIGPRTRASIRTYQEENGLEITGQIDKALLASLGI